MARKGKTEPIDVEALLDSLERREKPPPPPPKDVVTPDREPTWTWRELLVLTGITIVATLLRLYRIDEWSFWIDEVHTLREGVLKTSDQFWGSPQSRYPLGYLALRWLSPILPGSSDATFRLPFAFFGVASVPVLAVVGRRLLGTGTALLAAALLAVSPWHIYWSQSCRGYTFALLFGLAAAGVFQAGIERGSGWRLLVSLVVAALAALTHPSAAALVVAMLAYVAVLHLARRRIQWPPRLDFTALLWFLLPIGFGAIILAPTVWRAVYEYLHQKGQFSLFHLINTTVFFLELPVLIVALAGAWLLWQTSRRTCLLLAGLAIVPILMVGVASFKMKATAQYVFFTLPFFLLLAAHGAWWLSHRRRLARFALLSILFTGLLVDCHLYFHYRYGDRARWREAAAYLEQHASLENDAFFSTNEPSMEWYLNPQNPLSEMVTPTGQRKKLVDVLNEWMVEDLMQVVKEAETKRRRVWLVVTEPELHETEGARRAETWIRATFHQVLSLPNWVGPKDLTVVLYRYDPPGS
jgi:uncharacterized membrane protein